ncbi:MAG: hypothetical protein WC346_03875 [Methanogenium sp.]|jgi:hypothetical protein
MAQEAQNGNPINEGSGVFKGLGEKIINLPITTPKPTNDLNNPPVNQPSNIPNNPSTPDNIISFDKKEGLDKITNDVILSKYNNSKDGLYFNSNGDIINEKGEVLLPKDKYETEVNTLKESKIKLAADYIKSLDKVTLEGGKEGTINANGELVDANNQVVMSKDQLTQYIIDNVDLDIATNDGSLPDLVSKMSGYEILDEHGNPMVFEDTIEGMAKREKILVEQEATKLANDKYKQLISSLPGIEDAINYTKINGSLDGFGVIKNYDSIKLDNNNATQQFNVIVENEMALGKSQDEAMEIATLYKDNDKLLEKSKLALDSLKKRSNDSKIKLAQEAANAEIEYENSIKEQTDNIANIINSGKLLNFSIPEILKVKDNNGVIRSVSRQNFIDYVTKRTYQGKYTSEQLDAAREPLERKVLFALLRFTNVDFSQLVSSMADDKLVSKYRNSSRNLNLGGNSKILNINNTNSPGSIKIKSEVGQRGQYSSLE